MGPLKDSKREMAIETVMVIVTTIEIVVVESNNHNGDSASNCNAIKKVLADIT